MCNNEIIRHEVCRNRRRYTIGLVRGCDNMEEFMLSVPELFAQNVGEVIYRGRNELRAVSYEGKEYVIKSFHHPHFLNAWVYGHLRPSKAERSLCNALRIAAIGVGTPRPVGYLEVRRCSLLQDSYYISERSACPYVFSQLFDRKFKCEDEVLRAIGHVTGVLHNHGYAHKDYGRGNILFGLRPGAGVDIELVDLNRMHVGAIDMEQGCRNLERLPLTPHMRSLLAEAYAEERGLDAKRCSVLMERFRSTQPGKIDGKY